MKMNIIRMEDAMVIKNFSNIADIYPNLESLKWKGVP